MNLEATPDDIMVFYRRNVDALRVLGELGPGVPAINRNPSSPFHGMSRDEFEDAMIAVRVELDREVTLSLIASAEATLRLDLDHRVRKRRPKGSVTDALRALHTAHDGRVPLLALLDCWADLPDPPNRLLGQFKQLYRHRHWLAHGRYWRDKSGISATPEDVWLIIEALFDRLPGLAVPTSSSA